MNNDPRLPIVLVVGFGTALLAHARIRNYWIAGLVAILVAAHICAFEMFFRLHLPIAKLSWMPMVIPVFAIYCLPVVAFTGLPFSFWRQYKQGKTVGRIVR